jgi:hypothetical protein
MSRLLAAAVVTGALLVAASPAGASVDKPKDASAQTGSNIIAVLIGVKPAAAPCWLLARIGPQLSTPC